MDLDNYAAAAAVATAAQQAMPTSHHELDFYSSVQQQQQQQQQQQEQQQQERLEQERLEQQQQQHRQQHMEQHNFLVDEEDDDDMFSPLISPAMRPSHNSTDEPSEQFPLLTLPEAYDGMVQMSESMHMVGMNGSSVEAAVGMVVVGGQHLPLHMLQQQEQDMLQRQQEHMQQQQQRRSTKRSRTSSLTGAGPAAGGVASRSNSSSGLGTPKTLPQPAPPMPMNMLPMIDSAYLAAAAAAAAAGAPLPPLPPPGLALNVPMTPAVAFSMAQMPPIPPPFDDPQQATLWTASQQSFTSPGPSPVMLPGVSPSLRPRRPSSRVKDSPSASPAFGPSTMFPSPVPSTPGSAASYSDASPSLLYRSPQIQPMQPTKLRSPVLQPVLKSDKETRILSANEVEQLVRHSNYSNLLKGDAGVLGVNEKSDIVLGVGQRRITHKTAEQKRRDCLKESYELLRSVLPNPQETSALSKVELMRRAYEHTLFLEKKLAAYEQQLHQHGVTPAVVVPDAVKPYATSEPSSPLISPAKAPSVPAVPGDNNND